MDSLYLLSDLSSLCPRCPFIDVGFRIITSFVSEREPSRHTTYRVFNLGLGERIDLSQSASGPAVVKLTHHGTLTGTPHLVSAPASLVLANTNLGSSIALPGLPAWPRSIDLGSNVGCRQCDARWDRAFGGQCTSTCPRASTSCPCTPGGASVGVGG